MDDDHAGKLRFRSIWISDLHLGSSACQAPLLLDFLRHTESTHLYLVGDVVDGWQLRRRWFWPQAHNDNRAEGFCARPAKALPSSTFLATMTRSAATSATSRSAASNCAKKSFIRRPTAVACWSCTATSSTG